MPSRLLLLVLTGIVVGAGPALAEPYIAVREGMPCSSCHVNITGGGKRTELVSAHAREILHYPGFLGAFSNPPEYFTGEINQYVALGSDLRVDETATFQDLGSPSECPPGGTNSSARCVSNDKVSRGRLDTNEISVQEFTIYGELRLIPKYLTLYIDQRFQPQTDTREAWGLLHDVLPWKGFVKAGRMFLPYGLQLQDDGAFIRGGTNGSANTGFSFNQQQAAFEIGFEPEPVSFVTAVSQGPSGDRDVQVTATLSTLFTELPVVRTVLAGGSFSRVGPPGSELTEFGFFAGSNIERLTLLGEVDFLSVRTQATNGETVGVFISYAEADYLLFDWLNFKAVFNYADDDGDLSSRVDDSENLVRFGFEPFLNRFVQLRLFYGISNGVRREPTHNQNALLAELHLFL